MLMSEYITPVMYTDYSGFAPKANGILSLVYKEAYKTTKFNYYLFDYGTVHYKTKGRVFSNDMTPIELYALTTYGSFGGSFAQTSIGGRMNFGQISVYTSISLTSASVGLATKSGYASMSVGLVGQTVWDAGIGFSIEANNTYLNVKAPLTLVLAVAFVVTASPAVASVAAVTAVIILITEVSGNEGDNYE